jgi:hypothetical protein
LIGGAAISIGMAIPSRMKHMKRAPRGFPKLLLAALQPRCQYSQHYCVLSMNQESLTPGMYEGWGRRDSPSGYQPRPTSSRVLEHLAEIPRPRALTIPKQELSISIVVMTRKSGDIAFPPRA